MATLEQRDLAFIDTLTKKWIPKERQFELLNQARVKNGLEPVQQAGKVWEFFTGVGKGLYWVWSQLTRLAPGDQKADPNSTFNQMQRNMQWADVERRKAWQDPTSFTSKAGEFVGETLPTIPLSMWVGALAGAGTRWLATVAPKVASKIAPFTQLPTKWSSLGNVMKFWALEWAKDQAIYDKLTTGETSLGSIALGATAGSVLWAGLRGTSKLLGKADLPITQSKAGAYTEWTTRTTTSKLPKSNIWKYTEEALGTVKWVVKSAVAPFQDNIDEASGMMSALKPKQIVRNWAVTRSQEAITKEINLANQALKKSGLKPKTLGEYNGAIKEEMKKIGGEIEAKTKQKLWVNMTDTARKLKELANNSAINRIDPAWARELKEMAIRMRTKQWYLSVEDAEFMNQFINDSLKNVASASETKKKGMQIIVSDLRDKLDDAISNIPWEFKELKKSYWALRNVYRDGISREIVYNRANPEWLISSYSKIEGSSDIMSGLLKMAGLDVKWGVSEIGKGLMKNKLGQIIKTKNDPSYIINKIFNP